MNVLVNHSHKQGIVAYASGGQTDATVLDHTFNIIDDCGTPNASCKLDAATCDSNGNGKVREVINNGTQDLELYPAASEEFYDGSTGLGLGINVSVIIAPGNGQKFRCFINGKFRFN